MGAIAATILSVTSEHVNDYVLRTSANGVEGNLMFVVFYYYLNMKPKIFDKNLSLLTLAVTLSFAVRRCTSSKRRQRLLANRRPKSTRNRLERPLERRQTARRGSES